MLLAEKENRIAVDQGHCSIRHSKDLKKFRVTVFTLGENGQAQYPPVKWFRKFNELPERKRILDEDLPTFELPKTDIVCGLLLSVFGDNIQFYEDTEPIFSDLVSRIKLHRDVILRSARFFDNAEVPTHNLHMRDDKPLKNYQQVATVNMAVSPGYMLLMEQGCGKTPCVITKFNSFAPKYRELTGSTYKAIIVCPNGLRTNWEREIRNFTTCSVKTTVLRGDKLRRMRLIGSGIDNDFDASVIITGYETLVASWETLQFFKWQCAVLDESQHIKNERTRRWKYMQDLRDNAERRYVLTGTPIGNGLQDLYTQFEFIGEGYSGFSSARAFTDYYSHYVSTDNGAAGDQLKTLIGYQRIPLLKKQLSKYAFIIRKEQVLSDLPEKQYLVLDCDMSKEQKDCYKVIAGQIERDLSTLDPDSPMSVQQGLVQLMRLSEVTSGYYSVPDTYDEDTGKVKTYRRISIDDVPKLRVLMGQCKELPKDEKAIIWCCHTENIKRIMQLLKEEGENPVEYWGKVSQHKRQKAVDDFNTDPSVRFMVANPDTAGEGLNLLGYDASNKDESKTDCTHNFYYSSNWSYLKRAQSQDRNHRIGTRRPCTYVDLVCPGTIDIEILAALDEKKELSQTVVDVHGLLQRLMEKFNE